MRTEEGVTPGGYIYIYMRIVIGPQRDATGDRTIATYLAHNIRVDFVIFGLNLNSNCELRIARGFVAQNVRLCEMKETLDAPLVQSALSPLI